MAEQHQLKVVVRLRPPTSDEGELAWDWSKSGLTERNGLGLTPFSYDRVFEPGATTQQLYSEIFAASLPRRVLQGYNGTVLAYGQSGSGKSHTMLGSAASPGICALVAHDLFAGARADATAEYVFRVTAIEIHNEKLTDLLDPPGRDDAYSPNLRLADLRGGGAVPTGAACRVVSTAEDMVALMERVARSRITRSTDLNERSSRSHCVIRVDCDAIQLPADSPPPPAPCAPAASPSWGWMRRGGLGTRRRRCRRRGWRRRTWCAAASSTSRTSRGRSGRASRWRRCRRRRRTGRC